ncbi:hypothetical protein C8F04DRAFT_1396707 [Mycena alexandri]|uniref:Uncharacterized protein n=1 Tax=Mycena alexandri TaxID=1745969 RepID=A0AAD6SRU6_9AGAR|nr:hypothetical protein C8F04DRAFT_1396707 [Mycena alexandri]
MPHPQYDAVDRRTSISKESGKIHSNDQLAELEEYFRKTHFLPETTEPARLDRPHNPPMPGPSFPVLEIPSLPSDWWHNATNIRIVNGTGDLWSGDRIPFVPDRGRCVIGISMEQARLGGDGIFHGGAPLARFIHPMLFHIPHPMLSIQWPGYSAVRDEYNRPQPLNIQQPLHLYETTTLAQLGQQVSEYFFTFSQLYRQYCNPRDSKALLLGPGGVNFNRLRLVKLWTSDHGLSWIAEVAVVEDYIKY